MKLISCLKKTKKMFTDFKNALLCFWHPRWSTSLILNSVIWIGKVYRKYYYRKYSTDGKKGFIFRFIRRSVQSIFLVLTFIFYLNPDKPVLLKILIIFFILIMLDTLIAQFATYIVFVSVNDDTLLAIMNSNVKVRDQLDDFFRAIKNGKFVDLENVKLDSMESRNLLFKKRGFKNHLNAIVEEFIQNANFLKVETLRIAISPFKYIISILLAFTLVVMALQVGWRGRAFSSLILQNEESRNIKTFCEDITECLYFSSITITTIGYGEVTPKASIEAENANNCKLRFPSTNSVRCLMIGTSIILLFTIFGSFSIAFRGMEEIMTVMKNPSELDRIIKEFIIKKSINPTKEFFIQ